MRPEELIGHTCCGQYAIRSFRGNGCAGWLFGAERLSQNPCTELRPDFGGGHVDDRGGTRVILEIACDSLAFDPEELQNLNGLQPHTHLLRCFEVGQSQDQDLAGASYMAMEAWKDTLTQVLTRRSVLDDQEARNLATGIGAALARYHAENRVHGDVRAERICLVDGQWKLAPAVRRKGNGKGVGASNPPTAHDDIYCLGLILLSCLSRKFSSIQEKASQQPVTPAAIEQTIQTLPESWQHWLRRCLATDPHQRCSAAELALLDAQTPPPVAEVLVDREADHYLVQWQPAGNGKVQVYRWSRGRCPARGEIWLVADIERITESVPLTMQAGTQIQLPLGAAYQIIVATIAGDAAVIGDSITLTWAADVERLKLTVEGKSVTATWDWPAAAHIAQVVVRESAFPTGPGDPRARTERCFRPGYMAEKRFTIPIDPSTGVIHVAVYAIYRHEDGWERASGRTTGARALIVIAPNIHVRYRVERIPLLSRLFGKTEPWRLSMRADRTATLPELTLVAAESGAPSDVGNGIPILAVPSQQYEEGMVVQKDFRPPEGARIENTRLLVRGASDDGVRLIPERGRTSPSSS